MCGGDVMTETKALPIFQLFSIDVIMATGIPYEESYLLQIKRGYERPTDKFKRNAAKYLDKTIPELFGENPK